MSVKIEEVCTESVYVNLGSTESKSVILSEKCETLSAP